MGEVLSVDCACLFASFSGVELSDVSMRSEVVLSSDDRELLGVLVGVRWTVRVDVYILLAEATD